MRHVYACIIWFKKKEKKKKVVVLVVVCGGFFLNRSHQYQLHSLRVNQDVMKKAFST